MGTLEICLNIYIDIYKYFFSNNNKKIKNKLLVNKGKQGKLVHTNFIHINKFTLTLQYTCYKINTTNILLSAMICFSDLFKDIGL